MGKYSKILIYIFLLTLINLGVSTYLIYKINVKSEVKVSTILNTPLPSVKPQIIGQNGNDDIQTNLTQIKTELRSLREILGITGSFEELANIIKTIGQTEKP